MYICLDINIVLTNLKIKTNIKINIQIKQKYQLIIFLN